MKQYDNLKYSCKKYLEVFPEDQETKDLLLLINSRDNKPIHFLTGKQLIKLFNEGKLYTIHNS